MKRSIVFVIVIISLLFSLSVVFGDDAEEIPAGTLYVYRDLYDPANHFYLKGLMGNASENILNENYTAAPYSGATSIECTMTLNSNEWGGWMFIYGYQPEGGGSRELDFATHPDAGMDLSGAQTLTFVAKGSEGGEKVEFFVGGMGYDGSTNQRNPDATYPDSTTKITTDPTVVTLTKDWQEFSIDVSNADMSYIGLGFGYAQSYGNSPGKNVFYLDEIRFNGLPESDTSAQQNAAY